MRTPNFILGVIILLFISCTQTRENSASIQSCKTDSLFTICSDTFESRINGFISASIKYHDTYLTFVENLDPRTNRETKRLFQLSSSGKTMNELEVPKDVHSWIYYDFIFVHDSIFISNQFDETFYLKRISPTQWIKVKKPLNVIFENEEYDISCICKGEFGGSITFFSKEDQSFYSCFALCPIIVNQVSGDYFVTNYLGGMFGYSSILKIGDPTLLDNSDTTLNSWKSYGVDDSEKRIEYILDTLDLYIPTSLVINDELLHFYSDQNGSYIGRLEEKQMKKIYQFDNTIYPQFEQTLPNGNQFLTFFQPTDSLRGFMEINGNNISLHYILEE